MFERKIAGWTFRCAGGRNASHMCAWAPGAPVNTHVPDAFIDFPRGLRGMEEPQLTAFCEQWLEAQGALPVTVQQPDATVEINLHFRGTRAEFLAWLRTWDPMRTEARQPAGGAW